MMKFKTGNLTVKIEWGWARLNAVDGHRSCKIPVNSASPTLQLISGGWSCSGPLYCSPFTHTQSGLKRREESFHYHMELEATLTLYLRWKNKPVYS